MPNELAHLSKPYPWQAGQWLRLMSLWKNDRLPHALLIDGVSGVGKKQLAKSLGYFLLCQNPAENTACGLCRSCMLNLANTHPDLMIIEPDEKKIVIKVEQIRSLTAFAANTSQQGGRKIILIDPAEAMNVNASNALLKCLEEPARETFLILISHQSSRLLPTIKSRCQLIECPLPKHEESELWLKEEMAIKDAGTLLRLSDHRPLAARDLADSRTMLVRRELSSDMLGLLTGKTSMIKLAQKWSKDELLIVLYWFACWLSDMIRWIPTADPFRLRDTEQEQLYTLCKNQGDYQKLFHLADQVLLAKHQLGSGANPNKQLLLEGLLALWVAGFAQL
jgi:DNA polymerase-3 subunit delta'